MFFFQKKICFNNFQTVAATDPNQYEKISNAALGVDSVFALKDEPVNIDEVIYKKINLKFQI